MKYPLHIANISGNGKKITLMEQSEGVFVVIEEAAGYREEIHCTDQKEAIRTYTKKVKKL